jgi:hypothetical protein
MRREILRWPSALLFLGWVSAPREGGKLAVAKSKKRPRLRLDKRAADLVAQGAAHATQAAPVGPPLEQSQVSPAASMMPIASVVCHADDLIDSKQLAGWLGVSIQWVEIARHRGLGPPFVRQSARRIRYRRGDVISWLNERKFTCTDQYAKPRREGNQR